MGWISSMLRDYLSGRQKTSPTRRRPIRRRSPAVPLCLEQLEDRVLPTAYVFVDFGDNFPGANHVLTTTVGAVRDVATAQLDSNNNPIPNTVIQGPQLTNANNAPRPGTSDPSNLYPDNTAVNFTWFNDTANQRAQMMANARAAFASVDVTVVDLIATAQTLADGRSVAGAASMADVIATLRGNNTTKDVYVIVAIPGIGPSNANPASKAFGANGYGGIAPVGTVLGETTDLSSSLNNHDDLVLNFRNDANTIVHEPGHAFGLRHSVTTAAPAGSAINNVLPTSEVMAYLSSADDSFFYSRYPMVRGDSNTNGTNPPLNNNDLEARQGQQTPFDQLRVDANVGENPNVHYISGTGANDIITVTRGAGNTANVSVQAFADTTYQNAITVPGTNGTTYSYTINLDRRLLIQGGLGNDRIIVDGAIIDTVQVDGMGGADTLIINDQATFASRAPHYVFAGGTLERIWQNASDPGMRVDYSGIEIITLNANLTGYGTSVDVPSLASATQLTVNLGNFSNAVILGDAANAINGAVTVNGGTGTDLLTVNDQATVANLAATYTVTDTQVTRQRQDIFGSIWLTVGYSGLEGITLNTGGSATGAAVNVTSLAAATPVTVNLSSFLNFVAVGDADNAVNGALTLNGGTGTDLLTVNDQATFANLTATYGVSDAQVARQRQDLFGSTWLTVGYSGLEGITLNTGGSATGAAVNVTSLAATPVTVNLSSFLNIVAVGDAASSVNGALAVNGGAGTDLLTVNDQATFANLAAIYTVTSAQVARAWQDVFFTASLTVGYSGLEGITLNTGASATGAAVNVTSLAAATPVKVNLSSFLNFVTVGDPAGAVNGAVTVNGGSGTDLLTVNDQATFANLAATYTFTDTQATRQRQDIFDTVYSTWLTVGYNGLEGITLNTGSSATGAAVNVTSLTAATPVTVNLSSFLNVVNVGDPASAVNGALTVNGAAGTDLLTVNDQATFANLTATYTVSNAQVARERQDVFDTVYSTWLTVGYSGLEGITLNSGGSTSGAAANVTSLAVATPVTVNLSSFLNIVSVGDAGNSLAPVAGQLTVHGSGGENVLTVNDQGSTAGYPYTVTANRITRSSYPQGTPPSISIGYDAIDSLNLNSGKGSNVIYVYSNAAGTSLAVRGAAGGIDAFGIGFTSDLNQILGPVSVYGQLADFDYAYYYDYLNTSPQTYTFLADAVDLTALRVERSGIAAVTYHGLDEVIPYLPLVGGNQANVRAVPATMFLNMFTAKNDVATLGSQAPNLGGTVAGLQGAISVTGIGTSVILDDSGDQSSRQVVLNPKRDGYGDFITGLVAGGLFERLDGTSSLKILGGTAGDIFEMKGGAFEPAILLDGGGGTNTLNTGASGLAGNFDQTLTASGFANVNLHVLGDWRGALLGENLGTTAKPVETVQVDGSVTSSGVLKVGELNNLTVNGDMAGLMRAFGPGTNAAPTVKQITINGVFSGILSAVPGAALGTIHLNSPGNNTGQIVENDSRNDLQELDVAGSFGGVVSVANAGSINIAHDFTGTLNITQTLGILKVGGNLTGTLNVPQITNLGLDDHTNTSPTTWTITASSVSRTFIPSGSTQTVTITANIQNLQSLNITGGSGGNIFNVQSTPASVPVTVSGGAGNNTLHGPNISNTWQITGANAGTIDQLVTFLSMPNLTGGLASDLFQLSNGGSVSGILDGAAGTNTLDYSTRATGAIVNLPEGTATGIVGGIANIANATGGSGKDVLIGNAAANVLRGNDGNDILIGGDGDDLLFGGNGRDILIGGFGADQLDGGGGGDILIGGYTKYDTQVPSNGAISHHLDLAALNAIMEEWSRTGKDGCYDDRIDEIQEGVGPHDLYNLTKKTVFDDGAADRLTGGSGLDWFFANKKEDTIADKGAGELVTNT